MHVLAGWRRDLRRAGSPRATLNVAQDDLDALFAFLATRFSSVTMDECHDPAYDEMDACARRHPGRACTLLCTGTLVDWQAHADVAEKHAQKPFRRTKPLKAFVARHLRAEERADDGRCADFSVRLAAASGCRVLTREAHILALATDEGRAIVQTHVLPLLEGRTWSSRASLEAQTLRAARAAERLAADWSKPSTAANFGLLDRGAKPEHETSKMSPFLSVGALSARSFYGMIVPASSAAPPPIGSGADQLLFREAWYAIAHSDARRATFWSDEPGWWRYPKGRRAPRYAGGARWSAAPGGARLGARAHALLWMDANAAMRDLASTGWLHHLRRLVADASRGLGQHFLRRAWFRHARRPRRGINRANWMWLDRAQHKQSCAPRPDACDAPLAGAGGRIRKRGRLLFFPRGAGPRSSIPAPHGRLVSHDHVAVSSVSRASRIDLLAVCAPRLAVAAATCWRRRSSTRTPAARRALAAADRAAQGLLAQPLSSHSRRAPGTRTRRHGRRRAPPRVLHTTGCPARPRPRLGIARDRPSLASEFDTFWIMTSSCRLGQLGASARRLGHGRTHPSA